MFALSKKAKTPNTFSMASKDKVITSNTHNVIASGTVLTGKVHAEEDFRIDGNIEGDISCKGKVIVGNSSSIKGNVESSNIEVFGEIDGNILCRDTVILRATAKVTGDIKTQTIEIEPGAVFAGSCAMITD